MTTPSERTRAVVWARELLDELQSSQRWPDIPDELRDRARRIRRHYPEHWALVQLNGQLPETWGAPENLLG